MIFGGFSLFVYISFPLLAIREKIPTHEVFTDASVPVSLVACVHPGAGTQWVGSEHTQPTAHDVAPRMETLTTFSPQIKKKENLDGNFFKVNLLQVLFIYLLQGL